MALVSIPGDQLLRRVRVPRIAKDRFKPTRVVTALLLAVCSTTSGAVASGPRHVPHVNAAVSVRDDCTLPPNHYCYSLQAFRAAYGIAPLLKQGIDGKGRTVVIVAWRASSAPAGGGSVTSGL